MEKRLPGAVKGSDSRWCRGFELMVADRKRGALRTSSGRIELCAASDSADQCGSGLIQATNELDLFIDFDLLQKTTRRIGLVTL
jgi:hypothetical protein